MEAVGSYGFDMIRSTAFLCFLAALVTFNRTRFHGRTLLLR